MGQHENNNCQNILENIKGGDGMMCYKDRATESKCYHALMVFSVLLSAVIVSGCAGIEAYPRLSRAGDTVVLAVDRQTVISKRDVTIRITDSNGYQQNIPGTDPAVRAWINVYPDPLSKLVVGRETGQNLQVGAKSWGVAAEFESDASKNWFDSFLFLDLPQDVAVGPLTIDVLVGEVSILPQVITMNIIPGDVVPEETGGPNPFKTYEYGNLTADQLLIMERAEHYTVSFSGDVVPTAIQVDIDHAPDKHNGGVGQIYVVQPRTDLNAISWTDNGTSLRVIITPSWHKSAEDQSAILDNDRVMNWFNFYIAGGVTGLQTPVISAYDENGALLTGTSEVTATIQ